jgi:RHS repeat-associated protein
MTDGNSNTTQYRYDARKRLTVTTYPDSTTKTNAYDGPGNLTSVTDQAGNQVQYTYDAANQLASVVQVNSPNSNAKTTAFGYDADGNPITFQDANSHTSIENYDLLNEATAKTLPDGTLTETRQYDSNGNLSSVTHFNGAVTTYTYDTLNRLLSRTTPGESTVSHTYSATGKYATTTDSSGTTLYTYDTMDRLTAKATPEGTLNYTYDAAGHVASIASSNTNGASMFYTYDSLNRLSTVVDNRLSGSNTTTYTYDDASNVGTVTYPNGVQSTFTYDTLNRVSALSSQVSSYSYQRGPTGNLSGATESTGRTESWSYDGIYRLTNETISLAPSGKNGSVSYGLDPVGNRTSDTSSLSGISSGSFSFNADDELASESYDQNGNVLATGGKTFAYDSQNELISMGSTASLLYDGFGNRVSKTANGVTTKYLVEDDVNPTGYPQVFDELTNGAVTRTYTYGLQRIDEEQVVSNTWTPSFYGYDGGGNVRNLTNASGTVTDQYEYDAFGNSFTVSGSTPNNYLYRGEQYDPDLGLYYLRARYYNPITGRFMSRDPLGGKLTDPESLNKFLYANGDPTNKIDPTGKEALAEAAVEIIVHSKDTVEFGGTLAVCLTKDVYGGIAGILGAGPQVAEIPTINSVVDASEQCPVDAIKELFGFAKVALP